MKILVTGVAGFIGYHTADRLLLNKKNKVVGIDSINNYYDKKLKFQRLKNLKKKHKKNFHFKKINLCQKNSLVNLFRSHKFDKVINLAAQVGVRYSLKNPNAYFESNLSAGYQQNIIASTDPLNHLAIWSYPSTAATTGIQDRLLIYNYSVNRWSIVELGAEMIFLQFSEAYTVDTLDNVSNSLDDLNVSFDSRYWLGGVVNFAGFDSDHKLIQFDGATLAATIETGEIEPVPGRRSTVTMVRPIVDGTSTARVTSRARAADSGTSTSYASLQTNGDIPVRSSGRYHKIGVAIAAAASWNDAQGVDLIAISAGNR